MQGTTVYPTAHLSHYGVDGTGRDSYINFDNGGMYRGFNLHGLQKFERGVHDRATAYRKPIIAITGMPLHYPTDGSGRDTYVKIDEGGFGLVQGRKRKNYLKELRTYSHTDYIPKTDILRSSQHRTSPFNKPQLLALNATQSNLSARLSQPKMTEDPYKEMRNTFRKSIGHGSFTTRASFSGKDRGTLNRTPF